MQTRIRILQTSLSIVFAVLGWMLLGAVVTAVPAQAATKTPSPATTMTVPPNWPWHSVVMKQYVGSPNAYTVTGASPANLADYYSAFGGGPEGLNSVHIYINAAGYFHQGCPNNPDNGYNYNPNSGTCTKGEAWAWTMEWLDSMLAECQTLGLTGIIGLHSVEEPSGYNDYYDVTSPSFWENDVLQLSVQVNSLINHLKNYDANASYAYDILPEPTELVPAQTTGDPAHAEQPEHWWNVQRTLINQIQSDDPGHWIVVKPGPNGGRKTYSLIQYPCHETASPYFCPYAFDGLVYSIHVYDPHNYTMQGLNGDYHEIGGPWPGTITAPNSATYYDEAKVVDDLNPVATFLTHARSPAYMYVGEFSAVIIACESNVWLQNMVDIWENQMYPQWGWAYFSQGGIPGWSAHYTYTLTPSPPPESALPSITYSAPIPASVNDTARWQDLHGMFDSTGYASSEGSCDP